MKALKRIFAVLLVSAMAFGLVAQAADSKETVTLTFSVDSLSMERTRRATETAI